MSLGTFDHLVQMADVDLKMRPLGDTLVSASLLLGVDHMLPGPAYGWVFPLFPQKVHVDHQSFGSDFIQGPGLRRVWFGCYRLASWALP